MSEQLLPDHLTPIAPQSLHDALKLASPQAVGQELSRASLLVLLAHVAEETGWRSCHSFNLGNVKHVPGDGRDYVQFRCNEIINGKEVWFDPPHPATSFRAYSSLAEGCVDYLHLLQRRFDKAWPAVIVGDAAMFAHLLKTEHYYTADEVQYTANVVALDKLLDRELAPEDPPPFTGALPIVDNGDQPTPPGDIDPPDDVA